MASPQKKNDGKMTAPDWPFVQERKTVGSLLVRAESLIVGQILFSACCAD